MSHSEMRLVMRIDKRLGTQGAVFAGKGIRYQSEIVRMIVFGFDFGE